MASIEEIHPGIWYRPGEGDPVAVVGGVHGDEPEGAQVVRELCDPAHPTWKRALPNPVWLLLGNPEALRLGARHSEAGEDLNRLFGPESIADSANPERERATLIREVLAPVRRLVDLHQTMQPIPPLAVIPDSPLHLEHAARLGVEAVVVGAHRIYGETLLAGLIDRQGGVGLTVETGQSGQPEALEVARRVAARFLGAQTPSVPLPTYEILRAIPSPAPGLRFLRPLRNGSEVRPGEILGTSEAGDFQLDEGGFVFLPREGAAPGEPCLLLARLR